MVLILMGTFLIIGVVALFGIRANARAELSLDHRTELFEIRNAINSEFQDVFADLRRLANNGTTRTFANETVSISNVSADTQQRLVSEFVALAQQRPDLYAEVRYVTRTGSVWTEVTNYDGIQTTLQASQDELSNDDALVYSLRQTSGNAVLGQFLFQRDAAGQMVRPVVPLLRFSAPVALPNNVANIAGAVQVDVYAEPILNLVNAQNLALAGRRFVLVMAPGQTIADTLAPEDTFPARGVAGQSSSFSVNEPELDQIVRSASSDFTFAERGGRVFSATQISLENSPTMPWFLLLTDDASIALGRADALGVAAFVASLLAGGLISFLAVAMLRWTLRPLSAATSLARQVTAADGAPVTVTRARGNDEIGEVMQAFAEMSDRVQNLTQELETQIGRYTRNLEIAARVGRETATLYEMEPLLNRAINLIVDEFGYYHAQVFLVDDVGENALLRYSHGTTGQRLLEQAHKIAVGSQSVIGQVTATAAPVVVNDTENAPGPHRFNPLLPDTRAEMAVPLQIGDQVIGALDIQSQSTNAFSDDDIKMFQLLADQIAVAINNAQLLLQTEARVEQIDNLNRQLTRSAWSDAETRLDLAGAYDYDLFSVVKAGPQAAPDDAVSAPIAIRGEVIGTIAATAPDGQTFSEGELAILRAVAERVALAIENARLFQETQASLAQTSLLYQISRLLNEADTLEDIVQAVITSVMPDAISGQVGVFAPYASGSRPELMELSVDWMADAAQTREPVSGRLMHVDEHPLLVTMRANQVTLVRDTAHDERLDASLRGLMTGIGAGSAVLIPFSVRGVWRGIVLIEFPQAREFAESEGRVYSTLIDQVGVAIENRLLLRQTELALSQIQRLYSASRIVNTAQNSEDFIRAALTASNDARFDFELVQMEGELDAYGWPTRLHFLARSENGAAITVNDALPLGVDPDSPLRQREPQVMTDEDTSAIAEYLRSRGKTFGAVFPLFSFNQPIALFFVTSTQARELPADDYEIYRALIGQMSTALQNRRLLEQTEEALDETRRLYETSRAITNASDATEVYRETAQHLADANLKVNHIGILLAGPTPTIDATYLTTTHQWSRPGTDSSVLRVGSRLTIRETPYLKMVIEADGAVVLKNLRQDLANFPGMRVVLEENRTNSVVLAAVRTNRKWLGVLVLESAATDTFDETFTRYAQAVADQLAVAIDNRQLFEESQLEAKRALALAEVGQLANRVGTSLAASIGEVFVRVAEPAGYDRWMLGLMNEDNTSLVIINQYQPELEDLPAAFDLTTTPSPHSLVDAALKDRTIIVNDAIAYPAFSSYSLAFVQSVGRHIVAPVRIGENVAGALMVGRRRDATPLDSRDEQLVTTLTAQVAVALENQRLYRSTETALQETSLLYEASRALGDATADTDLIHIVTQYLTDEETNLVFLTTLTGMTWDSPGATARIAASWQRSPEDDLELKDLTLPAQQFPAWQLFASSDYLLIENVNTDTRLTPADRLGLFGMDMVAAAILPLRAGRRDLGALVLGWSQPRRFGERDTRIYSAFAEQASLKLEASRLLAQTERRARQLATSAEVGRVASTILNLDQLLPRMVDLIRDAFGYDHTQVFLMDEDEEYAELRASTGEAGRQLLAIQHKLAKGSQSVIGQVTATGEPTLALDTRAATVVHRPNPYLPNTRSEMAVPLVIKGHVVGALDVQSNQPNAFDEDDVAVLTTLATQISVAIDNARLFEQSGRRASEMAFLFNVTTAAASAGSLEHALQNVAQELLNSLDALSVSIYLPQVYTNEEETRTVLQPVALAGPDQPLSELADVEVDASSGNVISVIAATRQPTILDHVDEEPSYLPAVHGARSAVVVPLSSAGHLIGLVAVEASEPEAYDNDTLTLLLTLSGTLSAIVQNQQLLEQLQETNDQLRELDKLKSDFLANMSHELRTPLNSIIGFSRVILKGIDGPLTEMQEQDLTTIYNSGQHLLNLINDILDQAKISAQKMELQIEPFEVKPVIDAVRSIGIGLIKDKPIDIYIEMASGLPMAYGDELRTRQILLNLVSNAAKFTREGAITLRAYTEAEAETGQTFVRIDVSDTGIGIAEQDIPLLFEAFRQVDSSLTRTVGGTGLGLPIAKSLCEMQGGKLLVESQVNVGSTFSVLVPLEPTQEAAPAAEADQTDSKDSTQEIEAIPPSYETRPTQKPSQAMETAMLPMLSKRQILLIEDNPDMVDQYRRILGREGFDIFAATIPLEAEAMASGLHPTIIIMDVNFAEGIGWEMLDRLKQRDDTLDIPVIVVTLSPEVERAIETGAFRVIQRPFMPEALVQAVQDAERESRIDRILIIDDQPESVRLLQQILQEHGEYRVFGANTGQDGIALVARRRPNLIILDLRMPEMDGFAVVQELRANPETANIPVMVVTGEALTETERQQLHHLDVLHKTEISLEEYLQFLDGVKTHLGHN
jgi:GAF domain-containing protein/DNA-binding response OmpR family regulator